MNLRNRVGQEEKKGRPTTYNLQPGFNLASTCQQSSSDCSLDAGSWKILFIDRDGTIIREPEGDCQVDTLEKLEFLPGVIGALGRIVRESDYRLVMVSNQDGLGTASFPAEDFWGPHEKMLRTLQGEGVVFSEVLIDDSFPEAGSPFRKPATGLVAKYMNVCLDREHSYVIGDRLSDMELARNMGLQGIFLGSEPASGLPVALAASDWEKIASFIIRGSRRAHHCRETAETRVDIRLDLDGTGRCNIRTGLGFFDHLLQQIARHGGVDLDIDVVGDLYVDEHHTIEDTALTLGKCFREALGSKKGIARYGFVVPMDEALASVALDWSGRSWLEWNVVLNREYVGDFPTEMARHFYASFCQEAGCTLHVEAKGENTHHVLESVFKAFARAVGRSVGRTGKAGVPSTKDRL